MRCERSEFIRVRTERQAGKLGNFLRGTFAEFRMCVQAGADCSAADRKIVEVIERFFAGDHRAIELRHVAGKFLTEREWGCILQMRATDFHDVRPLFRFRIERVAEFLHRGKHIDHRFGSRHVHRRRKRVVRGLRHVHVIVRMHRLLRAHLTAGDLDRAVGDDFVDIHVRLRARARLPYAQREMRREFSGDYFVGGLHDEIGFLFIELAEVVIDERGGLFQLRHRFDHLARHHIARRRVIADIKMDERTRGLRAVIFVGRDLNGTHRVGFSTHHIRRIP